MRSCVHRRVSVCERVRGGTEELDERCAPKSSNDANQRIATERNHRWQRWIIDDTNASASSTQEQLYSHIDRYERSRVTNTQRNRSQWVLVREDQRPGFRTSNAAKSTTTMMARIQSHIVGVREGLR